MIELITDLWFMIVGNDPRLWNAVVRAVKAVHMDSRSADMQKMLLSHRILMCRDVNGPVMCVPILDGMLHTGVNYIQLEFPNHVTPKYGVAISYMANYGKVKGKYGCPAIMMRDIESKLYKMDIYAKDGVIHNVGGPAIAYKWTTPKITFYVNIHVHEGHIITAEMLIGKGALTYKYTMYPKDNTVIAKAYMCDGRIVNGTEFEYMGEMTSNEYGTDLIRMVENFGIDPLGMPRCIWTLLWRMADDFELNIRWRIWARGSF